MKRWLLGLGVTGLLLAACAGAPTGTTEPPERDQSEGDAQVTGEFAGTVPAPDFPPGLDWINVDAPVTMDALRGKVVLLDFWTYGCINCIHMIPTLERLEAKYPDELVIIGVHSAKFATEGETDNLRQIVQRYDLHHPVINDKDFLVWQTFGANAWPTFAIIDPQGNLYARQAGEIPFEAFDRVISGMIAEFDAAGQINREPFEVALEGADDPGTPLLFPGKVLADESGNRLFIADSNHHRIVIADLTTYEVLDVIGSGQRGFDDGGFEQATFNKPQGMALNGDTLYVADTNNHAIRAIDLAGGTISTLAGTGQQGVDVVRFGVTVPDPTGINLRSPWDVEMGDDDTLYIAMAGTHQIWAMSLADNTLQVAVGSGREALDNATLGTSGLAQPSGLYYDDGLLYFADSESSSIRVADLNADEVRTISGPLEDNLFDFADVDGPVGTSRLQHPLGVVGAPDGLIYITDTYNSRIKQIDPASDETTTLFGLGGEGGFRDGGPDEAAFDEPGGLDYAGGKLYVADTNNHAIRVIDLQAGTVSTVTFPNPEALRMEAAAVTVVGGNSAIGESLTLPEQTVAPGAGQIVLQIDLPDGFKINDLIDSSGTFSSSDGAIQIEEADTTQIIDQTELRLPVALNEGSGSLTTDLTLYYCRETEQELCFIDSVLIDAPVTVSAGADATEIVVTRTVTPPDVE